MPIIRAISAAYRSLMTLNVRIVRSKTIKSSHDWSYYWNNLIVIASLRTHTIIYFQPLLAIMIQSYHLVYFDKSCTLKKDKYIYSSWTDLRKWQDMFSLKIVCICGVFKLKPFKVKIQKAWFFLHISVATLQSASSDAI